jgi:hypothetical protein
MSLNKARQSSFKYCPPHIALYGFACWQTFFPEEWADEALAGVTEEDLRHWWCTPCRMAFLPSDDQRPAHCPRCDAVAIPTDFRWLPRSHARGQRAGRT